MFKGGFKNYPKWNQQELHVSELVSYVIQTIKKCIIRQDTYGVSTVPPIVEKIMIETIYCSSSAPPQGLLIYIKSMQPTPTREHA